MNVLFCLISLINFLQFDQEIKNDTLRNSLSFEFTPNHDVFWRSIGNEDIIESMVGITSVHSDSDIYFDGKQSWVITNQKKDFNACVYAYLNLPGKARRVKVSIYSKTTILNKAWLKLYCLDVNENTLKKDSVSIINYGEWQQFSIEIEANKVEKLYIEIEAQSKDMSLTTFKDRQKLWIDKCQIQIDGIDLNYFPQTLETKNKRVKGINELDSSLKGVELIDDIKSSKIIAMGESVHGSYDMQHCSFEFIKYLIQYENCRLVLFELNFELGMWLNEYVIGEVEDENIEKRMILYNYDYQSFVNLLKWIKNFNKTSQEKVRICGFDENLSIAKLQGFDHLIDFVKNKSIENESFTVIYECLKTKEYNKAIDYLLEKKYLIELDSNERISLIRALELRQKKYNPNPSILGGDREYVQFQNTKFAIKYWLPNSSKAVIYAHLGHVNKLNSITGRINISNFGKYMHQYYEDDYFVIALLTGDGTITNSKPGENLSILPLSSAINGSLEKLLMASESSFYYVRTSKLKQAYFIRTIGFNYIKNQFYPSSFKNKFDALIFIRNSTGYSLPKTTYEKNNNTQGTLNRVPSFFK